jgi:NTP pyrophosphatase (non-canonical NTP hydrolase)
MHLNEFQKLAQKFDQNPKDAEIKDYVIPHFGAIGEVGALIKQFKKRMRDGKSHTKYQDNVKEILGNLLWYVANVATKNKFSLEDIAAANLKKISERWPGPDSIVCVTAPFDRLYPKRERFPDELVLDFIENPAKKSVQVYFGQKKIGNYLTDNSYSDDGYRYHDIFHLSYAAILGWSPVMRDLLRKKRKSNKKVDEVEDGARATIIEEIISHLVYDNAKDHRFYYGIKKIDHDLIKTIKNLVSVLEVRVCTTAEWERAILLGYSVFRKLVKNQGGKVSISFEDRNIKYLGPTSNGKHH